MLTGVKIIQDDESELPLATMVDKYSKKHKQEPTVCVPTAEEIARDFGMEDCDDFMTALRDTMGEEDV